MSKLSETMQKHLMALADGPRSAYPGLSMGTLEALQRRNLVQFVGGVGSMAFPRNALWKLTKAGEDAIGRK